MTNNLRRFFFLCFVVSIVLSFMLMSFAQETEESMTVKFSLSNPLEPILSHESALARVFKHVMEINTNGRIKVELYPSNVLGDGPETMKMLERGTIQFAFGGGSTIAPFAPMLGDLLNVPFLFPNYAVGYKVFQGNFGKEYADAVYEKSGLRIIAYPLMGFSWLTNNIKPIHSVEDLKGIRIRCMEVPLQLATWEAMGARPSPVAWSELYGALQTGVVEGQYNALPGILAAKLYEVQKYVTLLNHVFPVNFFMVNDEWLKSLSESDSEIFWDAVRIAMTSSLGATRIAEVTEEMGIPFLEKQGLEVYKPSQEEIEGFKKLVIPEIDKYIEKNYGEEGVSWHNKLKDAIKIAEDEVKQGDIW